MEPADLKTADSTVAVTETELNDTEHATAETGEVAPESAGAATPRPSVIQRLRQPRNIVTALLSIALVAALAVVAFQWNSARTETSLRQEAVDTAREYSIILSTFDYQNLDANKDKIASMSTDEFAGTYRTMVDSLRAVVSGGQGQATATAANVGVESVDDSSASVLVFSDQQAKNVTAPDGNAQKYRMLISMTRSDGKWLVNNVEIK